MQTEYHWFIPGPGGNGLYCSAPAAESGIFVSPSTFANASRDAAEESQFFPHECALDAMNWNDR
jgi:hypothetical protein